MPRTGHAALNRRKAFLCPRKGYGTSVGLREKKKNKAGGGRSDKLQAWTGRGNMGAGRQDYQPGRDASNPRVEATRGSWFRGSGKGRTSSTEGAGPVPVTAKTW